MKKIISRLLLLACVLTLVQPVLATNMLEDIPITQEELMAQIEEGTATLTNETRDISSYTTEEINGDEGLKALFDQINVSESRSINTKTVTGTVYTTKIYAATGDTIVYRSTPSVKISATDVGTSSSADFYTLMTISESVTVNGELNNIWDNYIRYSNISVGMGCGINSAFTQSAYVTGSISTSPSVNLKAIIALIANRTEHPTVAAIFTALNAISYPSSTYVTTQDINDDFVRDIGAKWKPAIYAGENYLRLNSSVSTVNSSLTKNVTANAAAQWKFDVYYGLGSIRPEYSGVTLKPSITYRVNVK